MTYKEFILNESKKNDNSKYNRENAIKFILSKKPKTADDVAKLFVNYINKNNSTFISFEVFKNEESEIFKHFSKALKINFDKKFKKGELEEHIKDFEDAVKAKDMEAVYLIYLDETPYNSKLLKKYDEILKELNFDKKFKNYLNKLNFIDKANGYKLSN